MNPKAVFKITYGMFIVSSKKGEKSNGQIANTVFQITSDPQTIAISISKQNLTHEYITESKGFTVSVLSTEAPLPMIGKFGFRSGRDIEKFAGLNCKKGATGVQIVLNNTLSYMECEVVTTLDMGTHTLFIGTVVESDIIDDAGEPMTYAYYHKMKGGLTPKNAPTFVAEKK